MPCISRSFQLLGHQLHVVLALHADPSPRRCSIWIASLLHRISKPHGPVAARNP